MDFFDSDSDSDSDSLSAGSWILTRKGETPSNLVGSSVTVPSAVTQGSTEAAVMNLSLVLLFLVVVLNFIYYLYVYLWWLLIH